jgi:hypothetical protein
MSKERTPTSYLEDDWGMTPPGGTNASGAEKTPNYEYGNPYRAPMPETEDWGLGKDGMTSFGHSDTVKETKGATWGMDKDEIARGYSSPKSDGEGGVLETRQPFGSHPQDVPDKNKWNRAQDDIGEGHDISTPGKEQLGSSKLPA